MRRTSIVATVALFTSVLSISVAFDNVGSSASATPGASGPSTRR